MLKVFLAIAIVSFTSFLGWFLSLKYRKKRDYFKDMCDFNDRFLSELEYQRRPLSEFIRSVSKKRDFYNDLAVFSSSEGEVTESYFTQEERAFAFEYLSYLGKGDAKSQASYFSSEKAKLEKIFQESEAWAKKTTELYFKLGFLAGLALLIVLV